MDFSADPDYQYCLQRKAEGCSNSDLKKELVTNRGTRKEDADLLVRLADEAFLEGLTAVQPQKSRMKLDMRIVGYTLIIFGVCVFVFSYQMALGKGGIAIIPTGLILSGLGVLAKDANRRRAERRAGSFFSRSKK